MWAVSYYTEYVYLRRLHRIGERNNTREGVDHGSYEPHPASLLTRHSMILLLFVCALVCCVNMLIQRFCSYVSHVQRRRQYRLFHYVPHTYGCFSSVWPFIYKTALPAHWNFSMIHSRL